MRLVTGRLEADACTPSPTQSPPVRKAIVGRDPQGHQSTPLGAEVRPRRHVPRGRLYSSEDSSPAHTDSGRSQQTESVVMGGTDSDGGCWETDGEVGPHLGSLASLPRDQCLGEGGLEEGEGGGEEGQGEGEDARRNKGELGRQAQYFLACFSLVVSAHSLLVFPALAARHGGGAFCFVYLLLMCVMGLPLLYLEISLGQYCRGGPIKALGIIPLTQGLSYGSLLLSCLAIIHNNAYTTWSLYYWVACLTGSLPWANAMAGVPSETGSAVDGSLTVSAGGGNLSQTLNASLLAGPESYFLDQVLGVSGGLGESGRLQPLLVVSLLFVWLLLFLALVREVASLRKVVCFTGAAPMVLLLVLLCGLGSTSGSVRGIRMFLSLNWTKIADLKLWVDSGLLVLTTLSCGTGGVITLSSFTHFHSNCFRNALIITIWTVAASTLAGACMFICMGILSDASNQTVFDVDIYVSGPSLGYTVVPAALLMVAGKEAWSALYFLLLLVSSLGSSLVLVYSLHSAILHVLPLPRPLHRIAILILLVIVLFLLSLSTASQAGLYVLLLLEKYVYIAAVPGLSLALLTVVMWLYGVRRFANVVADMKGTNETLCWRWIWKFVAPGSLVIHLVLVVITNKPLSEGESRRFYPGWSDTLGWILASAPLAVSLIVVIATVLKTPGTFVERVRQLLQTPRGWGLGSLTNQENGDTELPDYVICSPDNFRPANALALVTANLYLPNLAQMVDTEQQCESEMGGGYLTDLMTVSSSDEESSEEENKVRGNWSNRLEFVLTCMGYVGGLGNVWRFPYLCYRNGGGAFFIPYLLMLVFCGLPLVYMELAFGQYASLGPITIWKSVPLCKGIGIGMVLVSGVVTVYYNMVIAWGFHYLFTSMTANLPWASCNNSWNTPKCTENKFEISNCSAVNASYLEMPEFSNSSCRWLLENCTSLNRSTAVSCIRELQDIFGSDAVHQEFHGHHLSSPADEYFYRSVLDMSNGLGSLGQVRWQLALCLLLTWAIIFLCLLRGIKSTGKVSYLMVTFPYVIILVLLVRGIMMDGYLEGIKYYVTPRWELLAQPRVWADAATQVFFSLSVCWGGLTTLASYNKFHNNIYRDAILICLADTLLSVLSGFAVFTVIGVLGKELDTSVENVIQSDMGLTFIVYPAAITYFPVAPLWSILFFLMIVMLGVTSMFTSVETIVTVIIDINLKQWRKRRLLILSCLCFTAYLLGLPLTTQGGLYVLQLMDEYVSGFPVMVIGLCMCTSIGWVYGTAQFCHDVSHMIGTKVSWWWRLMWRIVSPVAIAFILLFSAVGYQPLSKQFDETKYPSWSEAVGFVLVALCVLPLLVAAIYQICRVPGSLLQRVRVLCQPEQDWGPALEKHWKYIDYYPAVQTMYSVDVGHPKVTTITDHIEFTTVGVRVPSLSQASLLPVSPGPPHAKKPMDMRQKAILNHAYSNPQCHLSTGSIEKLGAHRQGAIAGLGGSSPCLTLPHDSIPSDVIIMPRVRSRARMRDAQCQTNLSTLNVGLSPRPSTSSVDEEIPPVRYQLLGPPVPHTNAETMVTSSIGDMAGTPRPSRARRDCGTGTDTRGTGARPRTRNTTTRGASGGRGGGGGVDEARGGRGTTRPPLDRSLSASTSSQLDTPPARPKSEINVQILERRRERRRRSLDRSLSASASSRVGGRGTTVAEPGTSGVETLGRRRRPLDRSLSASASGHLDSPLARSQSGHSHRSTASGSGASQPRSSTSGPSEQSLSPLTLTQSSPSDVPSSPGDRVVFFAGPAPPNPPSGAQAVGAESAQPLSDNDASVTSLSDFSDDEATLTTSTAVQRSWQSEGEPAVIEVEVTRF